MKATRRSGAGSEGKQSGRLKPGKIVTPGRNGWVKGEGQAGFSELL